MTTQTTADTATLDRQPTTHDYTCPRWGHDYAVMELQDGGQRIRMGGWGKDIAVGDFLLLQNGESTTRYVVTEIEYESNPPDQWLAWATFAPRPASVSHQSNAFQEDNHDR